jgi:uncharacterized membrane protein YqiK
MPTLLPAALSSLELTIGGVGVFFFLLVAFGVLISRFYRKVDQGKALIINKMAAEPEVTFTGGIVIPIFHRAEVMDISVKTIELERKGSEGLICRDNIRADIKVTFFVRVNKTKPDVLKVAQAIGCARASEERTLENLFTAKFSEALKTVGKRLDFEQLYTQRDDFKDQIIEVIGKDLNGYSLEDAAIDFLEQTPLESLDPHNILDSQGIRKITEMTTTQNIETNRLKNEEAKRRGSDDLNKQEALLNFNQRANEAQAKADKEISLSRTREENEALRFQHEEQKRTLLVKQKAEEEISINEQNKARAVEVAQKNREKEVSVEGVRVQKARDLEEISREREVEFKRIEKEKILEHERKNIADVIRDRIAVERGVAEEEERIKDIRVIQDAERQKKSRLITAEGIAQESLVKQIKAAEAQQEVSKFEAKQRTITAEAELEASDKLAKAKIRLSDGVQAEAAAQGLANVRVQEASAIAIEKEGLAKARVTLETMQAEAAGTEKQGLARVKVREADLAISEREGTIKATLTREQLLAEASGAEQKGLADARVLEAHAQATEKQGLAEAISIKEKLLAQATAHERHGLAEAVSIKEKLLAEAAGIAEKATAMKALDDVSRQHEEFRLRLDKERAVEMEHIRVKADIARAQADVLSHAFSQAKINIVGGDGAFFERFINAVSLGQSSDAFLQHSDASRTLLQPYLSGDRSLPQDLRDVLSRPALNPADLQHLSISTLLAKLALSADPATQSKLSSLLQQARDLGVADTPLPPPPAPSPKP